MKKSSEFCEQNEDHELVEAAEDIGEASSNDGGCLQAIAFQCRAQRRGE